jgi:hypothetical protein
VVAPWVGSGEFMLVWFWSSGLPALLGHNTRRMMEKSMWLEQMMEDGFTEEHIAKLRRTNKSIHIEQRWEYGLYGVNGTEDVNEYNFVKGRKPHINKSVLINYYINGKNHWYFTSSRGCFGFMIHLSGETLSEFTEADHVIVDTINHPDYKDYCKKFKQDEPIETIPLRPDKFLPLGYHLSEVVSIGIAGENEWFTLMTFSPKGEVDQHIQLNKERLRKILEWVEKQE